LVKTIICQLQSLITVNLRVGFAPAGYLLLFCETKKPDTGGVFWLQAMEQLFLVLAIYAPWRISEGRLENDRIEDGFLWG